MHLTGWVCARNAVSSKGPGTSRSWTLDTRSTACRSCCYWLRCWQRVQVRTGASTGEKFANAAEFGKQGFVCATGRGNKCMEVQADPRDALDLDHLKVGGNLRPPTALAQFCATIACLATNTSEGGIITKDAQLNRVNVHHAVRGFKVSQQYAALSHSTAHDAGIIWTLAMRLSCR